MNTDIAVQVNPMLILQQAVEKGASIEQLAALMDLADKWDARKERKAAAVAEVSYRAAMSRAQGEMKRVEASTANPQTGKKYADYASVDRMARPIYTAEGFSLSFDTTEGAPVDWVRIICDISHKDGHREQKHLDMPADGKGAKGGDVMTKTHATGSAITYGMRQLAKMIWNIAIGEDDDDGNGASKQVEHDKIVAESCAIIEASETLDDTQQNFAQYFSIAEKQRDKEAMTAYTAARDWRKIALQTVENEKHQDLFAECITLEAFNTLIPVMRQQPRLKVAAAIEAKKRGYKPNRTTGLFEEVSNV
jgi:hypothetical protein